MPPSESSPCPGSGPPAVTLSEAVRRTAEGLRAAGIDEPMSEARWLVAAALGLAAIDLVVSGGRLLDAEAAARITDFTRRRAAHEPLSRILGEREFYGRGFALSPGTLDPRPDTEVLVDMVLELCQSGLEASPPLTILDVGTGTGAILVTLLAELTQARGTGIDISDDALNSAAANALRHGVAGRATFLHHDIRQGPPAGAMGGRYDLIVSNPPYIPTGDLPGLQPEVRLHDPQAALDGGADGLDFYRMLVACIGHLADGGWIVVEVGAGQAPSVVELFSAAVPGAAVRTAMDLAGHIRTVAAQPHPAKHRE